MNSINSITPEEELVRLFSVFADKADIEEMLNSSTSKIYDINYIKENYDRINSRINKTNKIIFLN